MLKSKSPFIKAQQLFPTKPAYSEMNFARHCGTLTRASLWILLAGISSVASSQAVHGRAHAIRPLANDFVVVGEASEPAKVAMYTPSIVRLDSGRLVACYTHSFRPKEERDKTYTVFLTSDDGGKTWNERLRTSGNEWRLFLAGGKLHAMRKLRIMSSDDAGVTWSEPCPPLRPGSWFQTAANYWRAKGNIYIVMETRLEKKIKGWPPGECALILMRAKEDADLTDPNQWTFASELPFYDALEGYKQNNTKTDFFGVPFFPQSYPGQTELGAWLKMDPMGWGESSVVQIMDPDHYWHDPQENTFHIFSRIHTGGTGFATLCKVVENPDGTMTTMLETVPSGKKMLFVPFPGGQMRFHIIYDEKTKLYWMVGSQATDSMTFEGRLHPERYGLPNNERHRMVLHFSKNMIDWSFAGVVAIGPSPKHARHYASMDIDGDDLLILSRSADEQAKSAHDGNLITFHRVRNFRELVY